MYTPLPASKRNRKVMAVEWGKYYIFFFVKREGITIYFQQQERHMEGCL